MRLLYVFLITLKSFLWLCAALHMVRFLTITKEMKKMISNAEYPGDDPRNLQDREVRRKICDEVIQAKVYVVASRRKNRILNPTALQKPPKVSIHRNFQRLHNESGETLPTENKVAFYKDHGTWKRKTMTTIECVRKTRENWFVAFDQQEERMYLIERPQYDPDLFRWIALLETNAKCNSIYSGPKKAERLFQYFIEQLQVKPGQKVADSTICTISINEHVRLCSATSEALFRTYRHSPNGIGLVNYVNTGTRRCSVRNVRVTDKETLKFNVIECSINRDLKTPQFYVLDDQRVEGAAFIFKRDGKGSKWLKLLLRLENLNVLREHKRAENVQN